MILTQQIMDIIEPLSFMIEEQLCDDKIVKYIQTIKYNKFEKLMEILFQQKTLTTIEPYFSLYKVEFENDINSEVYHHIDIYTNPKTYHTTIQTDDNLMLLHILSPPSLIEYIVEHNDGRKYIVLPLIFGSELSSNHQTMIAIDLIDNKAYLINPNGRSDYFKYKHIDKKHINFSQLIDKLLEYYFNELINFGIFIEYIPNDKWNKEEICINYSFKNSIIGSGFCVSTSILLAQYLTITGLKPEEMIIKFKHIDRETLLNLINNYTYGLYTLLENMESKEELLN